jgi:hypothetical protein
MDRRSFGKGAAVAGLATALGQGRVLGAGERIGVGIIGCGGKGQSLWKNFLAQPDVDPVAVADVYGPFRDKGKQLSGGRARTYSDFRQLLDDKDVQAVIIATPDHWHARRLGHCPRARTDRRRRRIRDDLRAGRGRLQPRRNQLFERDGTAGRGGG